MKAYVYGASGAAIADVARPSPKGSQVLLCPTLRPWAQRADHGVVASGEACQARHILGVGFYDPDVLALREGSPVAGDGRHVVAARNRLVQDARADGAGGADEQDLHDVFLH